jgi:hypothetical protein
LSTVIAQIKKKKKIAVKNICGNNICGYKMTLLSKEQWHFQTAKIFSANIFIRENFQLNGNMVLCNMGNQINFFLIDLTKFRDLL